jgi:hypothetical protein
MTSGRSWVNPKTHAHADTSFTSPPPIAPSENGSVPTIRTSNPAARADSARRHPPKTLYASPKTAKAMGMALGTVRVRRSLTAATVQATRAHAYGRIVVSVG